MRVHNSEMALYGHQSNVYGFFHGWVKDQLPLNFLHKMPLDPRQMLRVYGRLQSHMHDISYVHIEHESIVSDIDKLRNLCVGRDSPHTYLVPGTYKMYLRIYVLRVHILFFFERAIKLQNQLLRAGSSHVQHTGVTTMAHTIDIFAEMSMLWNVLEAVSCWLANMCSLISQTFFGFLEIHATNV